MVPDVTPYDVSKGGRSLIGVPAGKYIMPNYYPRERRSGVDRDSRMDISQTDTPSVVDSYKSIPGST